MLLSITLRLAPSSVNQVNPAVQLTPLQAAARRGHVHLIQLLIASGADLEAKTASGETPLLIACIVGYFRKKFTLHTATLEHISTLVEVR